MYCLFLFLTDGYGGAEQRLCRIFNAIAYSCKKIDLIIIGTNKQIEDFVSLTIKNRRVNIIACKNAFEAAYVVLKNKYKVISFFDSRLLYFPILLAGKFTHAKLLMTIAYTKYSLLQFESRKIEWVFNKVVSLADHIDVLYPSSVANLKAHFPRKCITATPNSFTDLERFTPQEKKKLIAFVGRLTKEKNLMLFLESINLCQSTLRKSQYRVAVCGSGEEYDSAVKYVNSHKFSDIVDFYGFINPREVLGQARVFVSLQEIQNYPSQALMEAVASGCYIIASDVGDTSLIVKPDFGRLVDLRPEAISKALQDFIFMEASVQDSIVSKAREFAEDQFQIDRSVEYFSQILFS